MTSNTWITVRAESPTGFFLTKLKTSIVRCCAFRPLFCFVNKKFWSKCVAAHQPPMSSCIFADGRAISEFIKSLPIFLLSVSGGVFFSMPFYSLISLDPWWISTSRTQTMKTKKVLVQKKRNRWTVCSLAKYGSSSIRWKVETATEIPGKLITLNCH